jgi:hypothetical protein
MSMSEQSCRHRVGPVAVEHRPGFVWARCVSCDAIISGWLGDESGSFEVIELRGVTEDVKDHLDRFHREVDLRDAEVLRLCAWEHVVTTRRAGSAPRGRSSSVAAPLPASRTDVIARWSRAGAPARCPTSSRGV